VPLLQPVAEHGLHHRAEPDPLVAEQPAGELGVEEHARPEVELGQARQVLGGGVQHDLGVAERPGQLPQPAGQAGGVDQHRPGTRPAELDQVGAAAVAIAGGAFGVHGHRPRARRQRLDRLGQALGVAHHRRYAVARLQQ